MPELNLHQMNILNTLIFKSEARFAEINVNKLPNDQFNYHLKRLIHEGLVSKNENGKYSLSNKGREFAGGIDIFSMKIERQAKTSVIAVCTKEEDGKTYYLMQKRLKHPNFGWYGFPSGKAKFGNFLIDDVLRELEEETGLNGNPELKIIHHVLVKLTSSPDFVEDKIIYYYRIQNPKGVLENANIEGENYWMTVEEIRNLENLFPDKLWIIENLNTDRLIFKEEIQEFENI